MINNTTCAQAVHLHVGITHLTGDWRPFKYAQATQMTSCSQVLCKN